MTTVVMVVIETTIIIMRGDRDGGGSGCYGNNDGSGYDGHDVGGDW